MRRHQPIGREARGKRADKRLTPVSSEGIDGRILLVRGQRVLLDRDLAALYGVETKRLNEQVKRNPGRFPEDFMFRLTVREVGALRSQIATSNRGRGGRRYRPLVFTEHGAIMATNVLNSLRAVETSVLVVRAFVRLREIANGHRALAAKLAELDRRLDIHDDAIREIMSAIRNLMESPEEKPRGRIGFHRR